MAFWRRCCREAVVEEAVTAAYASDAPWVATLWAVLVGGGGGIEIGALGNIEISGFVLAHGGAGGNGDGIDGSASAGGGGGSGGGIFMHGATVTFLDSGGLNAWCEIV
jgi:hypothetical protein